MLHTHAQRFHPLRQGLLALRRDWRSGELRLLSGALTLAVAAVCSVGFLSDRVHRALQQDSAQVMGGDLLVQADTAIPEAWVRQAHALGLETTQTLQFPTMASTAQGAQLAALKAVFDTYPLRGQLRVARDTSGVSEVVTHGPMPGEVWVDPGLLAALDVHIGQTITVGDIVLPVTRTIVYEPDRGVQFVNVAPRIMLHHDDVAHTGLMVEGSRIRYTLVLTGPARVIQTYTDWLQPRLQRGQSLRTLADAQPNVQRTLDRARSFLALVTTLTVLVAAIAVALAARRHSERHRDGMAVIRCLGAARAHIRTMLWVEFLALGSLASIVGAVVGYAVHVGLAQTTATFFDMALPLPSGWPVLHGMVTGLLLLLGFAIPPLENLTRVAPVRVLRRSEDGLSYRWPTAAAGGVGFFLLIGWISGEGRLTAVIGVGFAGAFLGFAGAAWLLIRLLGGLRHWIQGRPALRFALAGMVRRKRLTITQLCALSLGLMVLLLLTLTRSDLLDGWRNTLPPNAPNVFLINIQPDQRDGVLAQLQDAGIASTQLSPMVRGRLVRINDQAIQVDAYPEERVRRLVDREFNLSWRATLPESNRLVQGQWLNPEQHEVSLEAGIAKDLHIALGDTLTFDVAGQSVVVTVTSIRTVKWDSLDVNFFALLSPSALEYAPMSFMTAFHLAPEQAALPHALVRAYPNLTVFDVAFIVRQLEHVLGRAVGAVQGLFLLTVLAGVLVLGAALYATRDARIVETAILRALGASAAQLHAAMHLELALMGMLAGLLAAAGAVVTAWALTHIVFDFPMTFSIWPWVLGVSAGIVAFLAGGRLALRGVLRTPPLVSLRETA